MNGTLPPAEQPVTRLVRDVIRGLQPGDKFTIKDVLDLIPSGAGSPDELKRRATTALNHLFHQGALKSVGAPRRGAVPLYEVISAPPTERLTRKRPVRYSKTNAAPPAEWVPPPPPSDAPPAPQPELQLNDRRPSKAIILDAYERDNPIDVLKNLVVVIEDRLSRALDLSKVPTADLLAEVARRTR